MKPSDEQSALRALRGISKKLPGAEEYVMVHHPAFRVGKKPFAIAGMLADESRATVSINLGPDAQGHLLGDERFSKTHYIGQHGWVTVNFDTLSEPELAALVIDSYRRIAGKKLLAQFDGAQSTGAAQAPARAAEAKAKSAAKHATKRASKPSSAAASSGEWEALGLSAPARRALVNAGFTSLRDLRKTSEANVSALHGMGPSGLKLLASAMAKAELRYVRKS
jgi:predicted DNA-binding protein (MmcQ/YjbR family)